jgi:ATP/maltotriose-dependent transcriptional regulator MalT/DNA-binding SARP family transcriptional activator
MQAALRNSHLCLEAPGGYGKTTLLHALLTQQADTHYFVLTRADLDRPYLQQRLAPVLARAGAGAAPPTLILDDVHLIAEVDDSLYWLHSQMAAMQARFVLSGRLIKLPESSLQLTWLRAKDLAFTAEETRAWLGHDEWHGVTQGWPLALALVHQIVTSGGQLDPALVKQRLFEQLAKTMVSGLPADLLRFLQMTAVPIFFTAELAQDLVQSPSAQWSQPVDPHFAQRQLQQIQQRNLFLEALADRPGWFKYHDLLREFLLAQATHPLPSLYERAARWFEQQGDFEQAIEHALSGRLYPLAQRLLLDLPMRFIRAQGRMLTYRRWVLSLPEATLATTPILLVRLGYALFQLTAYSQEAWHHVQQGLQLADAIGDQVASSQAQIQLGHFHYRSGDYAAAQQILEEVLANAVLDDEARRYALRLLSVVLAETAQFQRAKQSYQRVIDLARAANDVDEEMLNRQNFATTVLVPRGEFALAAEQLQAALRHFNNSPATRLRGLTMLCDLLALQGDWAALTETLQAMETLSSQVEAVEHGEQLYAYLYRAMAETGRGHLPAARQLLDHFRTLSAAGNPMAQISVAWLECWLLRREGYPDAAIAVADAALAGDLAVPYYRAQLALMRDVARALQATGHEAPLSLHPETKQLIKWRAHADLLHLHALLALAGWRIADQRWHRRARAVLRGVTRPGYHFLLTQREPELAAAFCTLCIAEDFASEQALAILRQLETITPLSDLLAGRVGSGPVAAPEHLRAWRLRAARALAALGAEAGIPVLLEALEKEGDAAVVAALETALVHLERQPPPQLAAQLLGTFAVRRNGQPLGEEVWPRPLVKKLFIYFCLHRGEALPRDRILDALWPDDDPQAAATTFRTVHSRLRTVLEPHLRPKAPSRYFHVEGDVYTFDPANRVQIDVETFTSAVRTCLRSADRHDMPPLPPAFLDALRRWQPLLPALPYEEWLIALREQLNTLYVEGCLYAANACLIRGELREAGGWAQRALHQAPWLEEAYQILMRCHARLDERSLALKTYSDAVAALERELGAPPSPLTEWLAARLRQGEEI